jgi:protein-tyrosine phosphatase
MLKVIFVCLGNICRSPMADAVFQNMVKDADLADEIMVDSAGTGRYHIGERAHRGTLKTLEKQGILYLGRARQFTAKDLALFDYVLAMDNSNLSNIQAMTNDGNEKAEVNLFLSYAYEKNTVDVLEVPDPYYVNRFDDVYDLVNKGSQALLEHIRAEHKI